MNRGTIIDVVHFDFSRFSNHLYMSYIRHIFLSKAGKLGMNIVMVRLVLNYSESVLKQSLPVAIVAKQQK